MSRSTVVRQARTKTAAPRRSEPAGPTVPFRLVTYNVDGLREEGMSAPHRSCVAAMAAAVLAAEPDVICLQEVTPANITAFNLRFCNSKFHPPRLVPTASPYYTITYVSKRHSVVQAERVPYTSPGAASRMGRDILMTAVTIGGVRVNILNSHLESGAEVSAARMAQLKEAMRLASRQEGPTVMCGDLNLRAGEWKAVSKELPAVLDLYEVTDAKKHTPTIPTFTWERRVPGAAKAFSSRYDRVFFLAEQGLHAAENGYAIVGAEEVIAAQESDWGYSRPSDHMGILASLLVEGSAGEAPQLFPSLGHAVNTAISGGQPHGTPREMAAIAALARAGGATGRSTASPSVPVAATPSGTLVDLTGDGSEVSAGEDADLMKALAVSLQSQKACNDSGDESRKRKYGDSDR